MKKGFTLIEILVSTALFTIVMVVALGALLSLSEAARKAEAINSAVNNLSSAIDSMSRNIRTGVSYHCGSTGTLSSPQDCNAASYFAFLASDGSQVAYCLNGTSIVRELIPAGTAGNLTNNCASTSFLPLTSPEIKIQTLEFYTKGSVPESGNDPLHMQARTWIIVSGTIQVSATQTTQFNLQTSVTQRVFDE